MLDSLKTVLHAGTNADMFRDCEIDVTFLPSAPIGLQPRKLPQGFSGPPEVSVPPKKQRFLRRKMDSEDCGERNSLPDSKVAWRRNQTGGEKPQVDDNRAN